MHSCSSLRVFFEPCPKSCRPPRYLLTGLLICDSCGSHYIVRNGKDYGCSSQGNGRDALCEQRIMVKKGEVEQRLLSGIKEQLLDPDFAKAAAKRIRAEARQTIPKEASKAQLANLDRQIGDIAQTICDIGRSEVLSRKLKELESTRREILLRSEMRKAPTNLAVGAAEQWIKIVSDLENLRHYAQPDEMESARAAIREIVGEVLMVEKDAHVFAKTKLNENMGFNNGAQKRT